MGSHRQCKVEYKTISNPWAKEAHPGLVEVYLGGSPCGLGGSYLVYGNTRNFAKLRPFSYKISTFVKFQNSLS